MSIIADNRPDSDVASHESPAATAPSFELVPEWDGKKCRVTAKVGGIDVHLHYFDVANANQRAKFAKVVNAKFPALLPHVIETELLKIAADGPPPPATMNDPPTPILYTGDELDVSHVHRPELFHTGDVSGLTVPVTTLRDGKPLTRWHLYLRWHDGRREVRPLADSLDRPDGGRRWLHPMPGNPAVNTPSLWSAESRRDWSAGGPTPDRSALFRDLCEAFSEFLEFQQPSAAGSTATLAIWTMLTYGYPAWPSIPYLYVGGPMASGKSRVFELLGRLVFRPLSSSNLTGPALFRTLHERGGVLLYDEAERLRQSTPDVQELLSMLLAGYKCGGQATRLEAVGDSFRPVSFDVFGPKAVACIQGLPPTLASRCIPLMMFRAPPNSLKPRRRPDAVPGRWQDLRDRLHGLALDTGPVWLELSDDSGVVPGGVGGRDYELWQPLLALAKWVESGGASGLLGLMQRHALSSLRAAKDDAVPEADEVLLDIVAEAVRSGQTPTSREVLDKAKERAPGLFKSWEHARTVSAKLKAYGLLPAPKSNGRSEYRLSVHDILNVQRSYDIDLGIPTSAIPD